MNSTGNDESLRHDKRMSRTMPQWPSSIALISVLLFLSGCASSMPTYDRGMLAGQYVPPTVPRHEPLGNTTTLKINDLISDEPNEWSGTGAAIGFTGVFMGIVPLISALSPPMHTWNFSMEPRESAPLGQVCYHLGQWEGEELIAEALKRSGLFESVILSGDKYDYEVRGKVDFTLTRRLHGSGFGVLIAEAPLLRWWVPQETVRKECRVFLEVLSRGQTNALFSRSYCESARQRFTASEHGKGKEFIASGYGQIFSQVIRSFVDDLAAALASYRTHYAGIQRKKPQQRTGQQDAAPLPRDPQPDHLEGER